MPTAVLSPSINQPINQPAAMCNPDHWSLVGSQDSLEALGHLYEGLMKEIPNRQVCPSLAEAASSLDTRVVSNLSLPLPLQGELLMAPLSSLFLLLHRPP